MTFEDRLRLELERASTALPVIGINLDDTLKRGRSRRRTTRMVAAAGVIALVVGAGAVVTRWADVAPAPQPPVASTPTEQPSASATARRDESPTFDRVAPVLRAWLEAIQDSDEDGAWALMTTEAQAEVGREAFDQMMLSALPEGLGAFADASHISHVVISTQDGDARVIAVVSGEVTREGTTEFAAMAIPMRVRAGQTLVDDPVVGRARYGDRFAVFASASAGPFSFRSGDELIVEFPDPAGMTDVVIALDDDEEPLPTDFDATTGEASATLERDLEPGLHVATVVVTDQSGRLYPEAIIFEAAAP